MDWTTEPTDRLKTLWDEGHSLAEIGRRMGISKNAVGAKANRLQLSARPSPIRRDQVARRLRSVGRSPTLPPLLAAMTSAEIAALVATESSAAAPVAEVPAVDTSTVAIVAVKPDLEYNEEMGPGEYFECRERLVVTRPAEAKECCWPLGEPGTEGFRFCYGPQEPKKPYCQEHAALAYVRVKDQRLEAEQYS